VEGVPADANPKTILKRLKRELACGGTYKSGLLELQGDHRERVASLLLKLGFAEKQVKLR